MDFGLSGWATLTVGAAVAGWIDAVIGGGGLVLIPLIMAVAPQLAPATALATNKVAAVSGTASAAWAMVRKVRPPAGELVRYAVVAALCSAGGAALVSQIDKDVMRPVIIVLMLAVGTFVALRPSFGTGGGEEQPRGGWRALAAVGAVAVIAFYDGVFGPGTGMFLIMAFTAVFSQNFLKSAAMAKVVNTFTNLGALATFIAGGHVIWGMALVLAVANVAGAQLGARTVLGGGTKLIRFALLALVVVMSSYLGYMQWVAPDGG